MSRGPFAPPHVRLRASRAAKEATPIPAVSQIAERPHVVSGAPKIRGAAACRMRAGAFSQPIRRPYPADPNNASGRVPLAIVRIPFPAPCRSAKA